MSRIGRAPIKIPKDVEVSIKDSVISVKSSKGELTREIIAGISVEMINDNLIIKRSSDDRRLKALHGLTRALINNMVVGVTQGFKKTLEVSGVGYRAQKVGEKISLQVGFTHNVEVPSVPGITYTVEGTNLIHISGINKELVGQVAARIRSIKLADHYKAKGIKYSGERIRLKAGKAAAKKR